MLFMLFLRQGILAAVLNPQHRKGTATSILIYPRFTHDLERHIAKMDAVVSSCRFKIFEIFTKIFHFRESTNKNEYMQSGCAPPILSCHSHFGGVSEYL